VKHAGSQALAALEPLLADLRKLPGLVERKTGSFYRRSKAFLHFHEDPAGLFADLKCGDEWERLRVSTAAERRALLRRAGELARA
jgi:hypothetical protein